GERQPAREAVTESWYTVKDMEATFSEIEEETTEWRRQAEERRQERSESFTSKLRGVLGGGRDEERYVVKETVPPRLFRMDDSTGPIYFELTEVEGGGTVVKATYNQMVKSQMAKFKAKLPLKIPATPIGKHCPSCGKPVLPDFSLCPYCGEKLITE
ncbi:MAG: zinc ribbon domain-containing protein, partial [Candidatus Bathyarchaeia archaeon]